MASSNGKKAPSRKSLRDKADRLAGAKCRAKAYCELAGMDRVRCGGVFQWAHIVGRANYRLRWEPWNSLCLCAGHHVYYTHHGFEWFQIIADRFPDQYGKILAHRNELFDGDYDRVIEQLQQDR